MRFWWLCTDELHWPVICTVIKGLSSSLRHKYKSHFQRYGSESVSPLPLLQPDSLNSYKVWPAAFTMKSFKITRFTTFVFYLQYNSGESRHKTEQVESHWTYFNNWINYYNKGNYKKHFNFISVGNGIIIFNHSSPCPSILLFFDSNMNFRFFSTQTASKTWKIVWIFCFKSKTYG